jgi:hypothetical protein
MRYAKRILVAAAIFSSYSAALAFDKIDSSGGSSSKKSTDNGAPAAKPNAPTASDSGAKARERLQQLSSGSSTLSSNKDISITTSAGNITFHAFEDGDLPSAKLLRIRGGWDPVLGICRWCHHETARTK